MKPLIPVVLALVLVGVAYAASAESGAEIYKTYCASCHMPDGKGIPGTFPALNNQEFLKSKDDNFIRNTISNGRPGTPMIAFGEANGGPLTDDQINDLVAFIRAWEVKEEKPAPEKEAPVEAAQMGEELYNAKCAACHGEGGKGTEVGPALLGNEFVMTSDEAAVKAVISEGRQDKGMPPWKGVLSEEQMDSLVTLLKGWKKEEIGVHLPQWDIGILVFTLLFVVMFMVYIYKRT